MSLKTWADRQEFKDSGMLPAAIVRCPCCNRKRAADSIVLVASVLPMVQARALASSQIPWSEWPEYACTAALATLRREGLATKAEVAKEES